MSRVVSFRRRSCLVWWGFEVCRQEAGTQAHTDTRVVPMATGVRTRVVFRGAGAQSSPLRAGAGMVRWGPPGARRARAGRGVHSRWCCMVMMLMSRGSHDCVCCPGAPGAHKHTRGPGDVVLMLI